MKPIHFSSGMRSPGKYFLGFLALWCLLAISACGSSSSHSVQFYDHAHVLDSSRLQSAASKLPNSLTIYTTSTFQGTQADFQRTTTQQLNGASDLIVMAIDTTHRYVYIVRGPNVQLSGAGINQAVSSFAASFNNGDYTSASLAAIRSMQSSITTTAHSENSGGLFSNPFTLVCCLVPLLLILAAILFAAARRSRIGCFPFRRDPQSSYYDPSNQNFYSGPPANQNFYSGPPANQNFYSGPPDQQGGMMNPPGQRSGMNPWMAGGLGAAAGGLLGYELGKREGERSDSEHTEDNIVGGGGSFGDFERGGGSGFGNNDQGGGWGSNDDGFADNGGGGSFGGGDDNAGGGSF